MRVSLPYIVHCQFKETARKLPLAGNVIHHVDCDIKIVEEADAPVVVRIGPAAKRPSVDVRFHDGAYYVPAHYDENADELSPASIEAIGAYPKKSVNLAFVSMIRDVIKGSHGEYGFNSYANMFDVLRDPLQFQGQNGRLTVARTNIFSVERDDPNAALIRQAAKTAYESNIVIADIFWRRCAEPRYVATVSNFGAVRCSATVTVEPLTLGPAVNFKQVETFIGQQAVLTFRLDRFEDMEDALRQSLPVGAEPLPDFVRPEIVDASVLSLDDEAYSLKRTAIWAVEQGWEKLKSESHEAAFAWTDMRKAVSSAINDKQDADLESLAQTMNAFASTTCNSNVGKTLIDSLKRWEMRPLFEQSHRM